MVSGAVFVMVVADLLAGGITLALISGGIVRSMRRLVEGTDRIGGGDLDHGIDVPAKDEMGELAGAFNRMAEKRQRAEEEVHCLNESLEERVEERTTQLENTVEDLRENELMLRESEERYTLVLEGSNDDVFDWDLRTGEVFWNDRFLEIIGLSRKELAPTYEAFLERLHPDDRQRVEDAVGDHLKHGSGYNVEYRIRHSGGGYPTCVARGKAQRAERGMPLRMAGIVSAITERKALEEQLEYLAFYDPLNAWCELRSPPQQVGNS